MLSQCKESELRKISLENCRLDDEELVEIVAAIGTLSNLEELDLEGNNLRRNGSVALGGALKACKNPQLRWLFLGENSIDDVGLRELAGGMRNCHNLTRLTLNGNWSITVDGVRALSTLFQSEHCWLEYINLSDIIDSDAVHVMAAGLGSLSSLETLNISYNSIGDDGARAIASGLVNLRSLKDLLLGCNSIGDVGAAAIGAGLVKLQSLEELDLEDNSIGDTGARDIASGLVKLRSLEKLNLGHNSIGDAGATAIGAGLAKLQSLKELYLSSNSIGDIGAKGIAAGLVKLRSVRELNLGGNSIGDVGAAAIGAGLVKLQSLKELHLEDNSIGDVGARAIAAGLVNLQSVEKLNLRDNSIGDLGIQALVIGLINSVDLKELCLSKNRTITASGLSSLSTLLQSESCSLTEISVWVIPFGDEGAVAFADALKGNKSMKHLSFGPQFAGLTPVGWAAFSKLLCDTSSVNATYLSNHSLKAIGNYSNAGAPDDMAQFLELGRHPAEHIAIHKILKSHSDFDVEPFFEWKLKLLPLVVSWFDRVWSLVDDHKWISDESAEQFQSRQLSAMYNFVRGMPLLAIDGYRSRNNTAVLAPSRKRKVDQLN